MPRADGPFEILERSNDNAYKVDVPGDYGVSATFNVADFSPYLDDNDLKDLRENSLSQGENDGGPSLGIMISLANLSPIACKGKLKEVLFHALGMHLAREHHGQPVASSTGTRKVVPPTVRHPGVPLAGYPILCYLLASIIASILVIFLVKMIALQVRFSAKKEATQLDFIKALKSGFYSSLFSFASKLPG